MSLLKRGLCIVCCIAVLIFTGCRNTENTTDTAQNATQEPDRIKIMMSPANAEIPNVKSSMDIPVIKHMAEKTNTIIDIEFIDHNKYQELVRLKFASGDFPDVYQAWQISREEIIPNDLVQELDELLDNYGPNLKQNIPQFAWDAVTLDGKIMAIPTPASGNAPSERVLFVRKDWMDKVGITDAPKTSDELLDLLRAFRDQDPNGNGQKDEIPFSAREKFTWLENITGMWGVNIDSFSIVDGEVVPGFANPNMKKALEFLNIMYEEGLLDSEFLTNSNTTWINKINQNKVGMWNHTSTSGGAWQKRLMDANPNTDADAIAIPTPIGKGYNGPVGRVEQPVGVTHYIFKESKVKEAAIRLFDWIATEEGSMFVQYGIEGDTLIKQENGTYSYLYDSDKMKANQTAWLPVFKKVEFESIRNKVVIGDIVLTEKTNAAFESARKEGIPNPVWSMPLPEVMQIKPDLQHTGTMIQEMMAKIVFGEEPIDYYDQVIEKWKEAGGDEIIKEATEWYNKNIKK